MSAWPQQTPPPAASWWVQVKGQAYGPYGAEQMAAFVAEGRVKPQTQVATTHAGPWRTAEEAELTPKPAPEPEPLTLRGAIDEEDARIANMMIWGELPGGGEDHIETTIAQFGAFARIAPDLWVLRTIHPVSAVRAAIASGLKAGERFLVVDASRGRLAWSNLGLDSETGLRRVWDAKG